MSGRNGVARGSWRVASAAALVYALFLGLRGAAALEEELADSTSFALFKELPISLDLGQGGNALAALAGVIIAIGLTGRTLVLDNAIDARLYARERLWRQLNEVAAVLCALVGIALAVGVTREDALARIPFIVVSGTLLVLAVSSSSTDFNFSQVERKRRAASLRRELFRYHHARDRWGGTPGPICTPIAGRWRRWLWPTVTMTVAFLTLATVATLLGDASASDRAKGFLALVGVGLMVSAVGVALVCSCINDIVDRSLFNVSLHLVYLAAWLLFGTYALSQFATDASIAVPGRAILATWTGLSFLVPTLLAAPGLRHRSVVLRHTSFSSAVHATVRRHIEKTADRLADRLADVDSPPPAPTGNGVRRWFDSISGA